MPTAKFEPKIPASEWPRTHALNRAATATGSSNMCYFQEAYDWHMQTYSNDATNGTCSIR